MTDFDKDKTSIPVGWLPIICICQMCGRAVYFRSVEALESDGWFIDLRRDGAVVLVRCPHHISDWVLKESMSGRTARNRRRAVEGRFRPRPPDAGREPLPTRFRGSESLLGAFQTKWLRLAERQDRLAARRVAQWSPSVKAALAQQSTTTKERERGTERFEAAREVGVPQGQGTRDPPAAEGVLDL